MKKIVIDIGNTNIVIGIYEKKWKHILRLQTYKDSDYNYALKLSEWLFEYKIYPDEIDFVLISSVVPELTETIYNFFILYTEKTILFDKNIYKLIEEIEITNPEEIGTDLVANAIAGFMQFKKACIIIDFGTALTFTVVDNNGKILGVNIAPGIKTAINSLVEKTSQLNYINLEIPKKPVGENTTEAIQNGILLGYQGLIQYMIEKINKYYSIPFKIILTGGLSHIYETRIKNDLTDKKLTLEGLLYAGNKILKKKN